MAYTPLNLDVFNAAFFGSQAGMVNYLRANTSSSASTFTSITAAAGAIAQELDTLRGAGATDDYELGLIASASIGVVATAANLNATPSIYQSIAQSILAVVTSGENYLSSQGITPPSPGFGPVSGPATSLNQGVATWNGTTGDNLQSPPAYVSALGSVTAAYTPALSAVAGQIVVGAKGSGVSANANGIIELINPKTPIAALDVAGSVKMYCTGSGVTAPLGEINAASLTGTTGAGSLNFFVKTAGANTQTLTASLSPALGEIATKTLILSGDSTACTLSMISADSGSDGDVLGHFIRQTAVAISGGYFPAVSSVASLSQYTGDAQLGAWNISTNSCSKFAVGESYNTQSIDSYGNLTITAYPGNAVGPLPSVGPALNGLDINRCYISAYGDGQSDTACGIFQAVNVNSAEAAGQSCGGFEAWHTGNSFANYSGNFLWQLSGVGVAPNLGSRFVLTTQYDGSTNYNTLAFNEGGNLSISANDLNEIAPVELVSSTPTVAVYGLGSGVSTAGRVQVINGVNPVPANAVAGTFEFWLTGESIGAPLATITSTSIGGSTGGGRLSMYVKDPGFDTQTLVMTGNSTAIQTGGQDFYFYNTDTTYIGFRTADSSANYILIWPAAEPSAGDTIRCAAPAAGVVQLSWGV